MTDLVLFLLGLLVTAVVVTAVWLVGVLVGIRLIFAGWTMIAMGAVGEAIADEADRATGES